MSQSVDYLKSWWWRDIVTCKGSLWCFKVRGWEDVEYKMVEEGGNKMKPVWKLYIFERSIPQGGWQKQCWETDLELETKTSKREETHNTLDNSDMERRRTNSGNW